MTNRETAPPAPEPDLDLLEALLGKIKRTAGTTFEVEHRATLLKALLDLATVSWLVARARRAEELEGWLTWRAAWTGADGPKNKAGVPWWRSAIEGEKPPRGFDR